MRRTPPIPDELRRFSPQRCPDRHPWCLASRNVYELPGLEGEQKMFASERMVDRKGREVLDWQFGDWDCDVLLLMQDAAPWTAIAERVGVHPDPFSARNFREEPQAGGAATNRELLRFSKPLDCRKLPGSALIGLLKPGTGYSGSIEGLTRCNHNSRHISAALRWVLDPATTPNLRLLVCLGKPAFARVAEILKIERTVLERLDRERGSIARHGRIAVSYLWHPQPQAWSAVGREAVIASWQRMAQEVGISWRAQL